MSGAAMIEKRCKNCGAHMQVREADHKRGWGKFCSKSCKAKHQTRRTGVSGPTASRQPRRRGPQLDGIFRDGRRVRCRECDAFAVNGVVSSFLADTEIDPVHGVPIEWYCEHHMDGADMHPFEVQ